VRELPEVLSVRSVRHDPRIAGHVGDGIVAGDELAARESLVENAVEALRLARVALDGVRHGLRRIDAEVSVLPGHRSQARHLPEQPLQRHHPLARARR